MSIKVHTGKQMMTQSFKNNRDKKPQQIKVMDLS